MKLKTSKKKLKNKDNPFYGLELNDETLSSLEYYMSCIGKHDRTQDDKIFDSQLTQNGISDKMTWNMDSYLIILIYGLFNRYNEVAKINKAYRTLTYKGADYTQQELIDEILNSLRIIIAEDYIFNINYYYKFIDETWEKIILVLPLMRW